MFARVASVPWYSVALCVGIFLAATEIKDLLWGFPPFEASV